MSKTYPIVKIPTKIQKKLDSSITVITSPVIEKGFDFLFPSVPARKPAKYPWLIFSAIFALWVLTLGGIAFKIVNIGIFIGAIAVSLVTIAIAMARIWSDRRIVSKKTQRSQVLAKLIVEKAPEVLPTAIDWSAEAKTITILRSSEKSNAQVGASEQRFLDHLKSKLPGQISFGHVYLPDGYNHPYSADIELILANGLCFQIEIDEPYVYKTREPHHCWDNDKDDKRDRYFLEQGWIIIRFSERQVVSNPDGSIGIIAEVLSRFGDNKKLNDLALLAKTLKVENRWSTADSRLMEKLKTREKYLSEAGYGNEKNNSKYI
jgi:Protein of unknown function (DUF559)